MCHLLQGALAPNTDLQKATILFNGTIHGSETVLVDEHDGSLIMMDKSVRPYLPSPWLSPIAVMYAERWVLLSYRTLPCPQPGTNRNLPAFTHMHRYGAVHTAKPDASAPGGYALQAPGPLGPSQLWPGRPLGFKRDGRGGLVACVAGMVGGTVGFRATWVSQAIMESCCNLGVLWCGWCVRLSWWVCIRPWGVSLVGAHVDGIAAHGLRVRSPNSASPPAHQHPITTTAGPGAAECGRHPGRSRPRDPAHLTHQRRLAH